MNKGKFETEALTRRRDALLKRSGSLTPWEGRELDRLTAELGSTQRQKELVDEIEDGIAGSLPIRLHYQ